MIERISNTVTFLTIEKEKKNKILKVKIYRTRESLYKTAFSTSWRSMQQISSPIWDASIEVPSRRIKKAFHIVKQIVSNANIS
jgi:hypothetical protein